MKRILMFIAIAGCTGLLLNAQDTVRATNLGPGQDAEKIYNSGISNYTNKNYSAALNDFNQAITMKPDFDLAYFNRGNTKIELKDVKGAIEDFNKAIAINASN